MLAVTPDCVSILSPSVRSLFCGEGEPAATADDRMSDERPAFDARANETGDIAERVVRLVGRCGEVRQSMGGFRIHVRQLAAFPYAQVLTALVNRNFKLHIANRSDGMLIEARP